MKIAIYGGAFNPVHSEHLNVVVEAIKCLELDKVIVIPTFISPHKRGDMSARGYDRLQMCRLAFKGMDKVEVSDYEIKKKGVSYSYLTCRHFKKLYPDDELYFIIGTDMFRIFSDWKCPQEILKCVTLAVCPREEAKSLLPLIKEFQRKFRSEVVKIDYVGKKVESTEVRTKAALGESLSGLVPKSVEKYIVSRKIYLLPEIIKVKKLLTTERWEHTVRVAVMADSQTRRLKLAEIDVITAAALHDCAKYLGEQAEQLRGFKPPKGVPEKVLHQFSGAYVAEHTFGIKDENILNAIRYHTSGRENMSTLEKLVLLSDSLEPQRHYSGVEKLRRLFETDLDKCLLETLRHQVEFIQSAHRKIYPLTRRAYEYIKEHYDK